MHINLSKDKNDIESSNEPNNDNNHIHEESVKIFKLMKEQPNYYFVDYNNFVDTYKNNESKNSINQYYLINLDWLKNFHKFCNSNDDFSCFFATSSIDNNNIIIEDDSSLKLNNDNKLYFNNKLNINASFSIIIKEVWIKLKELFGGGPEYEIIYEPDKGSNLIYEEGCLYLLFLKNSISNLNKIDADMSNFEIEDYMHEEHIYIDLNKDVKYLKQYINSILLRHKNKFFTSNIANIDNIEENRHYRLWLYSTFFGTPKEISKFFLNQLINLKAKSELNNENNLIDWTKFEKISEYNFQIIPISFFENYLIKDIFPNRYTENFNYTKEFGNLKNEEEHCLPFFTILIEEAPFSLMTEDIIYKIGKCAKCSYKQILYNACECKNLFFCLKSCENNYKEKNNNHYNTCKIHLINFLKQENNKFYHNNELDFPLKGLANLGNTCYMNSALQCMRSVKELTKYFLNFFDENQLNLKNPMGTEGFLALSYANFIFSMHHCDKNFLELKKFKSAIGIIDERFKGYEQQDTHEFLTFLIDSLHEDLNKVIVKPKIDRRNSDWEKNLIYKGKIDKLKSEIEWNNFLKRNQSIFVDLFYGQYKTTIFCPKCTHNSINFSTYLSLQLPIPVSNNFFTIKIGLYEEWFNIKPWISFDIILSKNNSTIITAKKIIANIFNISPYQIEIFRTNKGEIFKVYNDDDEIEQNITFLRAVKINLKTIKNIDNTYAQNIIDYNNIEKNVENKMDDYVSYVKNIYCDNNNNNSMDDCDIIIDINEDNAENIYKINYENYSLKRFIIKHYCYNFYKKEISNYIIHKDYLIYTSLEQSCYDLYLQFFYIYFPVISNEKLGLNEIKDSDDFHNYNDEIKKIFDNFFKKYIDEDYKCKDNIFNKYPDLPFYLRYKPYQNKESKFIPNSKTKKFKNFINNQQGKNEKEVKHIEFISKNSDNSKKTQESHEDNICLNIEINNKQKNNNYSKEDNIKTDSQYPKNNVKKESNKNNNNNDIQIEKDITTDSVNINSKKKEKKNNNNKNIVNSIIIVFNQKYLLRDDNGSYNLTDYTSEKKDLCPLFKSAHQNFEKISINKCFEEFTKLQTLDENNLYKCPKCKESIAAKNKIELYQIPKILIIQLKRFENGQKIKTFIDFPLKNLDISPFMSPSSPTCSDSNYKYDLFAISNHYGELEYGHYDAYCLNYMDNKWYNFNDKKVTNVENNIENTIVTKDAYVLFYRLKNMNQLNWDNIYRKQFVNIIDDNLKAFNIDLSGKNNFQMYFNNNNHIELNEDEENEKEDINSDEEISLNGFIYNPFRTVYLRLKRKANKK